MYYAYTYRVGGSEPSFSHRPEDGGELKPTNREHSSFLQESPIGIFYDSKQGKIHHLPRICPSAYLRLYLIIEVLAESVPLD